MERISYINGEFVPHKNATVSIDDRGYLFADGVYEVLQVCQGVAINYDDHMKRLQRSLSGLRIDYSLNAESILPVIKQLLQKNKTQSGVIYLQITRGVAARAHAFPNPPVAPTILMTLMSSIPTSKADREYGVKAITHPDLRWKRRDLKTISLLPNILAKEAASQQQAVEAILVEENKTVTEGSSMNVFMVDNHQVIWTHPEDGSILGGITRRNIILLAQSAGLRIKEQSFDQEKMLQGTEVFLTSTTKHVLPVVNINNKIVGDGKVGPITRQLIAVYEAFVEGQIGGAQMV